MNNKRKTSIRDMILIPVIILGLAAMVSNITSIASLLRVNTSASTISDEYLVGVQELSGIENSSREIHTLTLSHIVAIDFNTMIDVVTDIENLENSIDEDIQSYSKYVDSDNSDYKALKSDYKEFKRAVKNVLAFSANSDSVSAYGCANGDLKASATAMANDISALNDEISTDAAGQREAQSSIFDVSLATAIVCIAVCLVSLAVTIIIVVNYVIKPLITSKKELESIIDGIENKEGDLTRRIPVTSNDEIAALSKGINSFMETLQKIFTLITKNSGEMESVVAEVLKSVRTSNDSASDLSAVTEELSAAMGEVSESANAINNSAESVNAEVSAMAERSIEINEYSKNMKEHAVAMEEAARNNMQQTSVKVNEILDVLNQAIEDSKSVDQVNSLTNDILNISSQTNLLALNASIEAARAGEAGRGFAVVASEISQLADSSRVAANHIQDINKVVTDAVHNLSGNANTLVEYMQEFILPDFEKFVEEGEQYRDNASYIESSMDDFTTRTEELKGMVAEIADSINSITGSINEGVKGLAGAADSTQTLVYDMDNISDRMDVNQRIAGDLQKETSIFKNL